MATKIGTLQNPEKTEALLPRTCLKAVADKNGDYISEDVLASDINALKDGAISSLSNSALKYIKTESYSVSIPANDVIRIDVPDDSYTCVVPYQSAYSDGAQLKVILSVIKGNNVWFVGCSHPQGVAVSFTLKVSCFKIG